MRVLSFRQLRSLLTTHNFVIERLVGYHYLPTRLVRPLSTELSLINRMGFDLILVARKVEDTAVPARAGAPRRQHS
ncbi:MAG: hypothetical protein M3144_11100, partial [Actinomycetota bacterium]|nr:hypothetical protein [Actinomycetota bacterium]